MANIVSTVRLTAVQNMQEKRKKNLRQNTRTHLSGTAKEIAENIPAYAKETKGCIYIITIVLLIIAVFMTRCSKSTENEWKGVEQTSIKLTNEEKKFLKKTHFYVQENETAYYEKAAVYEYREIKKYLEAMHPTWEYQIFSAQIYEADIDDIFTVKYSTGIEVLTKDIYIYGSPDEGFDIKEPDASQ